MAETDSEMQLRIWKELAIGKQVLMRAATDALGLDPDCSQDELKLALDTAIKRAAAADVSVRNAQEQAKVAVSSMEEKLSGVEKTLAAAEAARAETLAEMQKLERHVADERANAAKEVKKLKERVAEQERAVKAVNAALGDTPDNVLKKLKALKKQKMDEADARKAVEKTAAALRKDKRQLEQELKDMQTAQESAVRLATQYRDLHALCATLHQQLAPLVEDADNLPVLPELDSALLEAVESAAADEQRGDGAKTKAPAMRKAG